MVFVSERSKGCRRRVVVGTVVGVATGLDPTPSFESPASVWLPWLLSRNIPKFRVAIDKFEVGVASESSLPRLKYFAQNLFSGVLISKKNTLPGQDARLQANYRTVLEDNCRFCGFGE